MRASRSLATLAVAASAALASLAVPLDTARAQAQPPAQPRAITLPDTMGADFSIADSATATGSPEDYDHFLGVWHFRFQGRRPDGTFGRAFTGHWTFRKRTGNRPLIEDYWRADNASQPMDAGTSTYRAWNPQRKLWEYRGTSTLNTDSWQPGLSWSDERNRYLFQRTGPGSIVRFRYFAIEQDRFLWRADLSEDDGKSWLRDYWTMDLQRVGR